MRFITPAILALALASLILAGCAGDATQRPTEPQPVACTADAKICPDGSAVGRVGPDCEFAACPTEPVQTTFREYKSQSVNQCMVMRFTCDEDEFFSDDTGCGCVREHNNAAVTLCPADYNPVCGWFDTSIQCITAPCAQTYPNLCAASIDPTVASTTPGECPAPGAAERMYISTNQTQCAASMWMCIEGMQQFYDDTGCGCEPVSAQAPKLVVTECNDPRPVACTREYMPVCGQKDDGTSDTYSNKCTACADEDVLSHVPGACEQPTQTLSGTCSDPRPEICTLEYMPVCGDNGRTYGNKCGACADSTVTEWTQGECSA